MAKLMKPADLSKLRKGLTKSIEGISVGFNDPETWIHTGSYALNYLISGDFKKGIPLEGKLTLLAGESGSGKSYIASGNIVRECQKLGIFPVVFDTENALDEKWLKKLGVDTSEDAMMKVVVSMIDDVGKFISDFVKSYKEQYKGVDKEERPPIIFIIDSLGMLLTPTDQEQFQKGDMKGDMGRKAKQITALCRNAVASVASENMGIVATNHTYASQDMFSPDDVIAGGKGLEYASSVIITLNKRKLKEDDQGRKTSDVHGIRAAAQVRKSRYAKPFEKIEIKIPYSTGMDPYSGVFDLFEKKELLEKVGNRYKYVSPDGEEFMDFRKNYGPEIFEKMMSEISEHEQAGNCREIDEEDLKQLEEVNQDG